MKSTNKYQMEEYMSRINNVIDYIEKHIDEDLTLEKLASVAYFSPFHFHRIFHAIIGETLNQFIKRVRIEKAAALLIGNPKKSITEIAFECGFSGSATFARSFKEKFNMSASEWRKEKQESYESKNCKANSNLYQYMSKEWEERKYFDRYYDDVAKNYIWRSKMRNKTFNIEVKTIEEIPFAYIRYIGSYQGNEAIFKEAFEKIFNWGAARNLIQFPETKVLSVYHDNPEITEADKLRTSIGISVLEDTEVDGEVSKMMVEGGMYAIGHFELTPSEYADAWASLYGKWLPESGYQPDDRPSFEHYLNDPKTHPEGKHIVDIYLPVKPL